MGSLVIGPRNGKYNAKGDIMPIPGHSVPIASLGAFILFLGFLAFNGGSVDKLVAVHVDDTVDYGNQIRNYFLKRNIH